MATAQIRQVRQFNRLVTQRVRALDDHFLGRDRPLGASRLLYEIAERGGADLRGRREMRELNARSDRLASDILESVSPRQRERLMAAMAEVHRLLRAGGVVIERVDPASPAARGLGIGRRLLEALEGEARELDATKIRLDTNKSLREAIALYRSAGYRQVPAFNAEPYATHWFEKRLQNRAAPSGA